MPARCLPERPRFKSRAEKVAFHALASKLRDVDVLLANVRFTGLDGDWEVDLVVGMPDAGFAAIEVKGGHVWREAGSWWQQTPQGQQGDRPRGPGHLRQVPPAPLPEAASGVDARRPADDPHGDPAGHRARPRGPLAGAAPRRGSSTAPSSPMPPAGSSTCSPARCATSPRRSRGSTSWTTPPRSWAAAVTGRPSWPGCWPCAATTSTGSPRPSTTSWTWPAGSRGSR